MKTKNALNRLLCVIIALTLLCSVLPTLTEASEGDQVASLLKFVLVNNDSGGKDMRNVTLQVKLSFNKTFEIDSVHNGTFDSVEIISADTIKFASSEIPYETNKSGYVLVRLNTSSGVTASVEETVYVEKAYDPVTGEVIVVNASAIREADCEYDPETKGPEFKVEILEASIWHLILIPIEILLFLAPPKPKVKLEVVTADNIMGKDDNYASFKVIIKNEGGPAYLTCDLTWINEPPSWKTEPTMPIRPVTPLSSLVSDTYDFTLNIWFDGCTPPGYYEFKVIAKLEDYQFRILDDEDDKRGIVNVKECYAPEGQKCCENGPNKDKKCYKPGTPEEGCCQYGGGCYDGKRDPEECRVCYDGTWYSGWHCEEGECIPEFATIAIPIVAIIGLMFLISRRKQKDRIKRN